MRELESAQAANAISPAQIYSMTGFSPFIEILLQHTPVARSWIDAIERTCTQRTVLEIGPAGGKLTESILRVSSAVKLLEQSSYFCEVLANKFSNSTVPITITNASFPEAHRTKWDVICARGVMLELLNEHSINSLADEFSQRLQERGTILFDYPVAVDMPEQDVTKVLYEGIVDNCFVHYSYKYLGMRDGDYFAALRFERRKLNTKRSTEERCLLRLKSFPTTAIEKAFCKKGFKIKCIEQPDAQTLFPGQLALFELRR